MDRPGDARYTGRDGEPRKKIPMRRGLLIVIALFGTALWSPVQALESGETCDIEDDAVQPDAMKELERILKELAKPPTS